MEQMSEQERYENGVLSHDLVIPAHLAEYLAQISLLEP